MTDTKGKHGSTISWLVDIADALRMRAAVIGYQEGCSPENPDCDGCWAREEVWRRGHQTSAMMQLRFGGLTGKVGDQVHWTGEIRTFPLVLSKVLTETRPAVRFPGSRSDVFHQRAPREIQLTLLALMALRPDDRFVFPTKRWDRARSILTDPATPGEVLTWCRRLALGHADAEDMVIDARHRIEEGGQWRLPNALIGASVGTQDAADAARPAMQAIAEAGWNTWCSSEPRRGPIDWAGWDFLDWLVVGEESGPRDRARRMLPEWVDADIDWTRRADVPLYVKQTRVDGRLVSRPAVSAAGPILELPRCWIPTPARRSPCP